MPTLKLRGDYLAIVTICAAEIIRYTGRLSTLTDFTGAAQGIPGKEYRDPFTGLSFFGGGSTAFGPWDYPNTGVNGWWVRFVAWALVLICTLLVYLLTRSPWGRMLRGIREDEDAIRSLGKNVFAIKMQALVIGGMLGALGGMVYILAGSMQADQFGRSLTFFAYTALLLGGAATIFGPILGTVLFYVGRIFVKNAANAYVPDSIMNTSQTEQFSFIVVGVALMLIVIFRPQGILGNKRELKLQCLTRRRPVDGRPAGPQGPDGDLRRDPGHAQAGPDPRGQQHHPAVRRHDRRRRGPPRGAARHHHRADRPQRSRQDHVLQPDHRLRQADVRARGPLVLRRADARQDGRLERGSRRAWSAPSS